RSPARFIVGLALISVAIVGLRIARDVLISGEVAGTIAGETTIRQVSVAANVTYYDALILAKRDWTSTYPLREGEDYVIGLSGVVPRIVWESKPPNVSPGSWFRRVYEPEKVNGWPIGPVGEWYVNFGVVGVFLGGFISGVLIRIISRAEQNSLPTPLSYVSLVGLSLFIFPMGYNTETPIRIIAWLFPLVIVTRYLSRYVPRGSSAQDAGTVTSMRAPQFLGSERSA
ncbi:MAG: oligosaccharide repeat unit polymerase, partial [Actinomycetota bacterium]|nr:oligosaccharide repeat unit polymerase [Actinomycetota bacterium]